MQRDPAPIQPFSVIDGWLPDESGMSSINGYFASLLPSIKEHSLLSPDRIIGTDDRFRIMTTSDWPWSTVVKIYHSRDSQVFSCSGWMVGASAIVTAGHCIYDGDAVVDKWAKDFIVIPGLNGSQPSPFGQCDGWVAHVPFEWLDNANKDYDWGVVTLKCQIGYDTGVIGFRAVSGSLDGELIFLTGYPGINNHPSGIDVSTSMWTGGGNIKASNTLTFDYDNDATGGQSGSAYWQTNNIPVGCTTPCILGTHASSFDPANPPAWDQGPRITQEVFNELYVWRQYKTHQFFIPLICR